MWRTIESSEIISCQHTTYQRISSEHSTSVFSKRRRKGSLRESSGSDPGVCYFRSRSLQKQPTRLLWERCCRRCGSARRNEVFAISLHPFLAREECGAVNEIFLSVAFEQCNEWVRGRQTTTQASQSVSQLARHSWRRLSSIRREKNLGEETETTLENP